MIVWNSFVLVRHWLNCVWVLPAIRARDIFILQKRKQSFNKVTQSNAFFKTARLSVMMGDSGQSMEFKNSTHLPCSWSQGEEDIIDTSWAISMVKRNFKHHHFPWFPEQTWEVATIIIPTILMRKLKFREVRNLPKVTQQGGGRTISHTIFTVQSFLTPSHEYALGLFGIITSSSSSGRKRT